MANLYMFLDKRRPKKGGLASLKIALSHKGEYAYKTLEIYVKPEEWSEEKQQVLVRPDKKFLNIEIRKKMAEFEQALVQVERRSDFSTLCAKEIMDMLARGGGTVDEPSDLDYVLPVFNEYITLCRKTSTAQVYKYTLNNLVEFCEDIHSLKFKDINVAWLRKYQSWLLNERKMEVNGANVYLRNLRTIFNYAINNDFTKAKYPFKSIDMSTTESDKREIEYKKFLDWATKPMIDGREYYRDLFMLSFYLCGIRPVDILHLKRSQVEEGRLVYYPEKLSGRTKLSIKIEPEAWEIINKYPGEEYLLNVMEQRKDYRSFMQHWNKALRAIGEDVITPKVGRNGKKYASVKHIGIVPYITIYYARRCWATYCYNIMKAPMDVISQGLGHSNGLRVTNIYVKRDVARVDQLNRELIDRLKADMAAHIRKQESA